MGLLSMKATERKRAGGRLEEGKRDEIKNAMLLCGKETEVTLSLTENAFN